MSQPKFKPKPNRDRTTRHRDRRRLTAQPLCERVMEASPQLTPSQASNLTRRVTRTKTKRI